MSGLRCRGAAQPGVHAVAPGLPLFEGSSSISEPCCNVPATHDPVALLDTVVMAEGHSRHVGFQHLALHTILFKLCI